MSERLVVPKFQSESEEADWWYANRKKVAAEMRRAVKEGRATILTKEKLLERLNARPVTIRLAETDLALAQKQAKDKGMPYQTYIKSLLHETLAAREKTRSRR